MTTEQALQAHLDQHPEDWQCRLVLADYLDEHADLRAAGYRALGTLRRWPEKDTTPRHRRTNVEDCWFFYNDDPNSVSRGVDLTKDHGDVAKGFNGLPKDWLSVGIRLGEGEPYTCNPLWMGYRKVRQEVEDFAALAFALLPPERQAELLNGS